MNSTKNAKAMPFEARKELLLRQLISDPKILCSDLKVAIAISTYLNRKTGYAFPGYAKLCKDTRLSRSTVQRAIGRLRDKHYRVTPKKAGSRRYANEYRPIWENQVSPDANKVSPDAMPF